MSRPSPKEGTSRREFATALLAAAATPLVVATAVADTPETDRSTRPLGPAAVAQALNDLLRARYGSLLSDEQLETAQHSLTHNLAAADRLRQFPLKNGDGPAVVFPADVR